MTGSGPAGHGATSWATPAPASVCSGLPGLWGLMELGGPFTVALRGLEEVLGACGTAGHPGSLGGHPRVRAANLKWKDAGLEEPWWVLSFEEARKLAGSREPMCG